MLVFVALLGKLLSENTGALSASIPFIVILAVDGGEPYLYIIYRLKVAADIVDPCGILIV